LADKADSHSSWSLDVLFLGPSQLHMAICTRQDRIYIAHLPVVDYASYTKWNAAA